MVTSRGSVLSRPSLVGRLASSSVKTQARPQHKVVLVVLNRLSRPLKRQSRPGSSWVPFKGTQGDPGGQGGQEELFWIILAPLAPPWTILAPLALGSL